MSRVPPTSRFQTASKRKLAQISTLAEDDAYDPYAYVLRREVPPIRQEPASYAPSPTRYAIVDRVFEDGVPIYVLQQVEEQEVTNGNLSTTSTASKPSLLTTTPPIPSPTAASQPTLRVPVFDILSYTSQSELENFENDRFEHPEKDPAPTKLELSGSEETSARDALEEEQGAGGVRRRRGRPRKKGIWANALIASALGGESREESSEEGRRHSMRRRQIGRPSRGGRGRKGRITTRAVSNTSSSVPEEIEEDVEVQDSQASGEEKYDDSDVNMEDTTRGTMPSMLQKQKRARLIAPRRFRSTSAASEEYVMDSPLRDTVCSGYFQRVSKLQKPPHPTPSDDDELDLEDTPRATLGTATGSYPNSQNRFSSPQLARSTRSSTASSSASASANADASAILRSFKHSPKSRGRATAVDHRTNSSHEDVRAKKKYESRRPKEERSPLDSGDPNSIAVRSLPISSRPLSTSMIAPPNHDHSLGEYEVERILNDSLVNGTRFYLVKWVGYSTEDATWQTEEDLVGAEEVLSLYLLTKATRKA